MTKKRKYKDIQSKKITEALKRFEKSPRTFKKYKQAVNSFFDYVKTPPDDYIRATEFLTEMEQKQKLIQKYKNDVTEWVNLQCGEISGITIRNNLSTLKGIFEHHDIIINGNFWTAQKSLLNKTTLTRKKRFTKDELRKILRNMDIRTKLQTMIQATAGLRIDEVAQLKFDDVKIIDGFLKIDVNCHSGNNTKRNRITFATRETTKIYKEYLQQRNRYIERIKDKNKIDENLIFVINHNSLRNCYNRAIKKAGFFKKDKNSGLGKYSTHTLRSYFKSVAQIPEEAKNYFFGHMQNVDLIYYNKTDKELLQEYKKGENSLSIYGYDTTEKVDFQEEKIKQLENTVKEMQQYMNDTVVKLLHGQLQKKQEKRE